jgi:hypothetical protein
MPFRYLVSAVSRCELCRFLRSPSPVSVSFCKASYTGTGTSLPGPRPLRRRRGLFTRNWRFRYTRPRWVPCQPMSPSRALPCCGAPATCRAYSSSTASMLARLIGQSVRLPPRGSARSAPASAKAPGRCEPETRLGFCSPTFPCVSVV